MGLWLDWLCRENVIVLLHQNLSQVVVVGGLMTEPVGSTVWFPVSVLIVKVGCLVELGLRFALLSHNIALRSEAVSKMTGAASGRQRGGCLSTDRVPNFQGPLQIEMQNFFKD
jgi:hypothetical protein